MPLHPDLASMLEKLDLVAVDVNEGWTVIRRRMFIDLFIGEKPYSSLEVFHHHSSGKTIVRIFGQSALLKGGTLSGIVQNVFLKKPCFGVWQDLDDVGGALDSMHLVNHVTKRYYSPQCHIFSKERYGKDRFAMTPALCLACNAITPRQSKYSNTFPMDLDSGDKIDNDVNCHDDSDSHKLTTKEEDFKIDLKPEVSVYEEELDMEGGICELDDEKIKEEPLDTVGEVDTSMASSTTGTLVGSMVMSAMNQVVKNADLSSDPLIRGQKALATCNVELAHKAQMVFNGEYRGKERPFAAKDNWAQYLYPNGIPNNCSVCGQYFRHRGTLQNHLQRVHYSSWFQCPVCLLWKNHVEDIVDHIEEKHPDKEEVLIKCLNCGQDFTSISLLAHIKSCLKGKYKMTKKERSRMNSTSQGRGTSTTNWAGRQCTFCHFTYNTIKDYKEHLSCHSEAVRCKYEGCNYVTDNKDCINSHTRRRHERTSDRMLPCDKCGKPFFSPVELKKHILKVHGNPEDKYVYHCSYCNLSFRSNMGRDRHLNVEHLNMSYPCEICGKTFPLKSTLTRHLDRVHDKEKSKVQCSICQKWLSCKETLDSHVRTHTGEKPYKCNFCDETFVSGTWMGIHRRKMHPDDWKEEIKKKKNEVSVHKK